MVVGLALPRAGPHHGQRQHQHQHRAGPRSCLPLRPMHQSSSLGQRRCGWMEVHRHHEAGPLVGTSSGRQGVRTTAAALDTTSSSSSTTSGSQPRSISNQHIDVSLVDQVVYTKFSWPAVLQGEEVYIWGSFNAWERGIRLHRFSSDQDASVIMPLQPGNYEFKFVADKGWCVSTHEPTITSSEGNLNNFRVVAPSVTFTLRAPKAQSVLVVGSWDGWQYSLLLKRSSNGTFQASAQLPPGQYSYYYIVDGAVFTDPERAVVLDPERGSVHKVWSFEPSIFRIFYCTGWETTLMHYRRMRNGQPLTQEWQELAMVNAPSRGNALGLWKMAALVPTAAGGEDEGLEFYLSNGGGSAGDPAKVDRPSRSADPFSRGTYAVPFPGSFKLLRGLVRPFPRGSESRIMLVSDIDGTMIGEMGRDDVFASSSRFTEYWENNAAVVGSLLVYNTGRSLGQFVDLMRKCDGKVAIPDVVITAVGTKVWRLDEECGRANACGLKWVEDMAYTQSLDLHWDLNKVRRHVQQLVQHYNDDSMLTVLDDGREHRHRMALCGDMRAVDHCLATLSKAFHRDGLQVRIIVSGAGSHRYIDCVSGQAGKEKALQYVRQQFGVPEHLCVAAGDSGNDVLMLEGDHPSIVVGNAQPELVHWLTQQRQTGKVAYTDAWYADGILEGLARHSLY